MKQAHWAVTCPNCKTKPIRFQTIENYDPNNPPILQGDLESTFPAPCPKCKTTHIYKRKDAWLDVAEI